MKLKVRPWVLADAAFVCKVRNTLELRQWFKQDKELLLNEQECFMASHADYDGFIIEAPDHTPVGICSLDYKRDYFGIRIEAEFGIAVLPEHQHKGYAKEAMGQLCDMAFASLDIRRVYSDVFVRNPALSFYLAKCGFKATEVKERAYFKKDFGLVDTVLIEKINETPGNWQ